MVKKEVSMKDVCTKDWSIKTSVHMVSNTWVN